MEKFLDETLKDYQDIGMSQDNLIKLIFLLRDNHTKEMSDIDSNDAKFAVDNKDRICETLRALKKFLIASKLHEYYKSENRSFIPLYFIAYHIFHKQTLTDNLHKLFDTYDTAKWNKWYCNQPSVAGSVLYLDKNASNCGGYRTTALYKNDVSYSVPIAFRTSLKMAGDSGAGADHHFGFVKQNPDWSWGEWAILSQWTNGSAPHYMSVRTRNAYGSQTQEYANYADGNYHIYDGLWLSTSFAGYVDGVLMYTNTQYMPTQALNPTFSNAKPNSGQGNTYVDWFLLRKYEASEPTWST